MRGSLVAARTANVPEPNAAPGSVNFAAAVSAPEVPKDAVAASARLGRASTARDPVELALPATRATLVAAVNRPEDDEPVDAASVNLGTAAIAKEEVPAAALTTGVIRAGIVNDNAPAAVAEEVLTAVNVGTWRPSVPLAVADAASTRRISWGVTRVNPIWVSPLDAAAGGPEPICDRDQYVIPPVVVIVWVVS